MRESPYAIGGDKPCLKFPRQCSGEVLKRSVLKARNYIKDNFKEFYKNNCRLEAIHDKDQIDRVIIPPGLPRSIVEKWIDHKPYKPHKKDVRIIGDPDRTFTLYSHSRKPRSV